MLVGKDKGNVLNSVLSVDNWETKYVENKETGELELEEKYIGLTEIGQTEEQTYLGFVVSSTGDNLANIRKLEQKSIGGIRKILNILEGLNLQKYYFECSVILMNSMLRPSILYASEMYYNLKENEIRRIERIEEKFMRKVLNTTKGCPIVQLYLTLGQIPARYEIKKMKLMFLKYILEQSEESLLKKFFNLQLQFPTQGDWVKSCLSDLMELNIQESFDEIRIMTKNKFRNILKTRVKLNALKYLTEKRGSKGKEMKYTEIEMSDYLHPTNVNLSIAQKQNMFAVKNRMIEISANFPKGNLETKCQCGKIEDMAHIYICELFNSENPKLNYENIFNGNLIEQNDQLCMSKLCLK